MSLQLANSQPPIEAKTFGPGIQMFGMSDAVLLVDYKIPIDDFCCLVEYVLTNTDVRPDDPRLKLVELIKTAHLVKGWQTVSDPKSKAKRIELGPRSVSTASKKGTKNMSANKLRKEYWDLCTKALLAGNVKLGAQMIGAIVRPNVRKAKKLLFKARAIFSLN